MSTSTSETDTPSTPIAKRPSGWQRLSHGDTRVDFVGRRWIGFGIAIALTLISLVSLGVRGFNLGIDFEGGNQWEMPADRITTEQVDDVLGRFGLAEGSKVQTLGGAGVEDRIRVQADEVETEVQDQVKQAFADEAGIDLDEVVTSSVSASWGEDITNQAIRALVVFFVVLAIYISFRFEWKMAISAFVAMFHDVIISVGVYSLFGFEVTPATVVAFLTILGFSLYDTIVVFDKVHENTAGFGRGGKVTYAEIVNLSMNQTLMITSWNMATKALIAIFHSKRNEM
jgi:preprotein translocase subunit SecF